MKGVVATSTTQAVDAGLAILAAGGNAADAAIAAAAALIVTEPTSNGLGGDAFAIVAQDQGAPLGLNASGRAPFALDAQHLRDLALTSVPESGWLSVTTPGVVSGWCALHERCGRIPFARILEPAIDLARNGFNVAPTVAAQWQRGGAERFGDQPGFEAFYRTWLLAEGRAPHAGETFRNPDLAATLELIAREGHRGFYEGLAPVFERAAIDGGGHLRARDLREHRVDWVDPIPVRYANTTIFELPPNGQGLVASIALAIADRLKRQHQHPSDESLLSPARIHRLAECLRQAIAEGDRHIADPDAMRITPAALIDDSRIAALANRIRPDRRAAIDDLFPPGDPGTVYLAVADGEGMLVSWIQSCYMGFGSGIVIPGTSISMQNRGCGFNLIRGHPNELAGGKRPFHTIIPAYAERPRERIAFGVMGGPMQPQGHLQLITAMIDHGLQPQEACAMPRFRVLDADRIALEEGFPDSTRDALSALGHEIAPPPGRWAFGGAQIARCFSNSALDGGTDPRKDGKVGRS